MTPQTETVAHTPGPWKSLKEDDLGFQVDVVTEENPRKYIATAPFDGRFMKDGESVANARLIAAAPTMYQELQLAADTFRDFSAVLRAIGKDVMAAAADVAERHIREYLATIANTEEAEVATGETRA